MKTIKMILDLKRPLVILFSALSLLAACKKDHDSHPAPVTSPISVVAAKAGDTIRIQGTNFTTDVNQVKVSFNGTAGTVVSASATEIVVVVPEGATTGNITVTVYENTVQAGTLTIAPLTYYTVKGTEGANNTYSYQLVSLSATNLTESVIFNLNDIEKGMEMNYIVYSPITNEILGLDDYGGTLIKINPTTKQKTTIQLSTELNIRYSQLVVDNANNFYALKLESTGNTSKYTLVKIDVATGKVTPLKPWKYVSSLSYLSSTNEFLGLAGSTRIAKYNLNSQDTSTVQLSKTTDTYYYDLFTDNKSNLYAYKTNNTTQVSDIVKLDPATLAESIVTTLSDYSALLDSKITYIPKRNEFVSIWNDLSLYRYDLGQKSTTVSTLSTDANVWYYQVITN